MATELDKANMRILELVSENQDLKDENKKVRKEFREFKEALKDRIHELKKVSVFKRVFGYIRLIVALEKEIENDF